MKLSPRAGKRLIVLVAAALSGLAVSLVSPTLADDAMRHALDGDTWMSGRIPNAMDAERSDRAMLSPPLVEVAAVVASAIDVALAGDPLPTTEEKWREALAGRPLTGRLLSWRLLLIVATLGATWEIIALLRSRGLSVWHAAVFAWSPAVWLSAAGLGVGPMLATWFFAGALKRADAGRRRRVGLWLALAGASSPAAWVAVPWVLLASGGKRLAGLWLVSVSLILWVPLLLIGGAWHAWVDVIGRSIVAPAATPVAALLDVFPRVAWAGAVVGSALAGLVVWRGGRSAVASSYAALLVLWLLVPTVPAGTIALLLIPAALLGPTAGIAAVAAAGLGGMALSAHTQVVAPAAWSTIGIVGCLGLAEALLGRRRRRRGQAALRADPVPAEA